MKKPPGRQPARGSFMIISDGPTPGFTDTTFIGRLPMPGEKVELVCTESLPGRLGFKLKVRKEDGCG